MKTTAKQLNEIQSRINASADELTRVAGLRMGVIAGGPSITTEQAAHYFNRAEMLAALAQAGPRLRAKSNAEQWENVFNSDGSPL